MTLFGNQELYISCSYCVALFGQNMLREDAVEPRYNEGIELTQLTTPENTITYRNALCLSPQIVFIFSWGHFNSQEKLKTMLMQNFGVTNKEHYGMLRYFWSGQFFSYLLTSLSGFPYETLVFVLSKLSFLNLINVIVFSYGGLLY